MSVFMSCSENELGAIKSTDYPDVWIKESFKGCVLEVYEKNGYDDSDFYARVWDAEESEPSLVEYGSTRYWTYANSAVVDASDEVKALFNAYRDKARAASVAADAIAEAMQIRVGKSVEISLKAGKNKALNGLIGKVFWVGPDKYGYVSRVPHSRNMVRPLRVGVNVGGQKVFLSEYNVVVAPEAVAA